jgi:hypothetical protein
VPLSMVNTDPGGRRIARAMWEPTPHAPSSCMSSADMPGRPNLANASSSTTTPYHGLALTG